MNREMNGLEVGFIILGVLEILGGIVLAVISFGSSSATLGISALFGISLSAIWLVAGVIFGMLFIAVARGLFYLRNIMSNTEPNSANSALSTPMGQAQSIKGGSRSIGSTHGAQSGETGSKDDSEEWICPQCGVMNSGGSYECKGCRREK